MNYRNAHDGGLAWPTLREARYGYPELLWEGRAFPKKFLAMLCSWHPMSALS